MSSKRFRPRTPEDRTPRFPLILKDAYGWSLVDPQGIVRFDAEDKYARVVLEDGSNKVVFHSLADLEERLACGMRVCEMLFVRTHRKHIVAMHHAQHLHSRRGITMSDGTAVPLSKRSLPGIIALLSKLWHQPTAV